MYKKIKVKNKDIMLYCENIDKLEELPIVVYHSYTPNIDELWNGTLKLNCKNFVLVGISNIKWDDEMTPYYMEALFKGDNECLGKADVDSIRYMPASLALHQRPNIPNIRSTFGTMTELSNQLRLLYSRCGNYKCPNCGHYLEPSLNVARDLNLVCENCHHEFMGLSAEEYAFNSDGACPKCQGTGVVREVDDTKLVPDENLTLEEGSVRSWNMFGIAWMFQTAGVLGVRTNV